MKKYIVIAALITVSCSKKETLKPEVKPLVEAVYASGFIVAKDEYAVFAQAEGYLSEQLAEEGQAVKKGQPLLTIDSRQQDSRFEVAKQSFELARLNAGPKSPTLAELNSLLATAASRKQFDSVNYGRYKNLFEKKATTQLELDRARLTFENSSNDFKSVLSRLERTRLQLNMERDQAASQLAIAGEESGRYVVRAAIDGNLLSLTKERGELVRRGEQIAVIGNNTLFSLRFSVDELDINRVKLGQEILVKIDAFGGRVFHATVSQVYPYVNSREQAIRVDATLDDASGIALYSGLGAEGNIIIRKKDNAVVIPKRLLLDGDSVRVMSKEGEHKVKITRGIETLDEVEVVDGLDTATELAAIQNP